MPSLFHPFHANWKMLGLPICDITKVGASMDALRIYVCNCAIFSVNALGVEVFLCELCLVVSGSRHSALEFQTALTMRYLHDTRFLYCIIEFVGQTNFLKHM